MKRIPSITLRGKKVVLRPPKPADFGEFVALMKGSRVAFRGLVRNFHTRKHFTEFVRRWERDDACSFLICRQEDNVIVGSIGLFNIVRGYAQTAFIGYSIGAPHQRQGFATEALQLVLCYAFKRLRLHRVEASIQPHNVPSIALVKRAGFVLEGFSRRLVKIGGKWRDHQRWAILVEDWRPRRN